MSDYRMHRAGERGVKNYHRLELTRQLSAVSGCKIVSPVGRCVQGLIHPMRRTLALCFASFVLLSRADTVTFTTITNLVIPDDTYNGSIASMAACPVPVA